MTQTVPSILKLLKFIGTLLFWPSILRSSQAGAVNSYAICGVNWDFFVLFIFSPLFWGLEDIETSWHDTLRGSFCARKLYAPLSLIPMFVKCPMSFHIMVQFILFFSWLIHVCLAQALFPDNTYGVDSGGDPKVIPKLTFEEFKVCSCLRWGIVVPYARWALMDFQSSTV